VGQRFCCGRAPCKCMHGGTIEGPKGETVQEVARTDGLHFSVYAAARGMHMVSDRPGSCAGLLSRKLWLVLSLASDD
jgi:hypothetical protein